MSAKMLAGVPQAARFGVFFPPSQACYMGSGRVQLSSSTYGICGPRDCPADPVWCRDSPAEGFPGATNKASSDAWPHGAVPMNLQCWPRNQYRQPAYCHEEPITVLETKETAGKCLNLYPVNLTEGETCEMNCASNVMCPAWQEIAQSPKAPGDPVRVLCYQGVGHNCFFPRTLVHSNAGRYMHGHYRVLMNLQHVEVKGLTSVSDAKQVQMDSQSAAITHCNHTCLSLLPCEIWQYSLTYGCRISNPAIHSVNWPLTTADVVSGTDFASTAIAGQYIQRLCGRTEEPETRAIPLAADVPTMKLAITTTTTVLALQTTTLPPQGKFVTGGMQVWWLAPTGKTKHLVPPLIDCGTCGCKENVEPDSQHYIDSIDVGVQFDCGLIPETTTSTVYLPDGFAPKMAGLATTTYPSWLVSTQGLPVVPTSVSTTTWAELEDEMGGSGPAASLPWMAIVGAFLLIGGPLGCGIYVFACVSPEARKQAMATKSLAPLCSGEAASDEDNSENEAGDPLIQE